jgi:sugar lactone lactonase YvrE
MELIFYAGSSLLEGPIWDSINKLVYCVSIEQGIIYQINPKSGEVQSYPTQGSVGCVALIKTEILYQQKKKVFLL